MSKTDLLSEYKRLRDQLSGAPASTIIVFVDLAGSTAYKDRYGLLEGALRSDYHNGLIAQIAERHGLILVKSLGDGLLLKAQSPWESGAGVVLGTFVAECFVALERNPLPGQPALESRIGIAVGQVVTLPDGDVLGPAVDLASRLETVAKPNQAVAQASLFTGSNLGELPFNVSAPVHIAIRGVSEPVAAVEIFPVGRAPKGIEYREKWTDYAYTASLNRIPASRSPRLARTHLLATIHLAYRGVLRSRIFDFVAMDAGPAFNRALGDPKIFSCFAFRPQTFASVSQAKRFFKVGRLTVAGIVAKEMQMRQPRPQGMFIRRRFHIPERESPPIGGQCNFSYTVQTVLPRRSSFFAMITEQDVDSPTFAFHAEAIETDWLRFMPFLPPDVHYELNYSPNGDRPTAINLRISGVIPAGSGVSFMWSERSSETPDA